MLHARCEQLALWCRVGHALSSAERGVYYRTPTPHAQELLLTYLFTHLLTHLLTYLLTHLLTYLLTHFITYLLT